MKLINFSNLSTAKIKFENYTIKGLRTIPLSKTSYIRDDNYVIKFIGCRKISTNIGK